MEREEILSEVLKIKSNQILLKIPTGVGKSRIALEWVNTLPNKIRILIVVPKLVLIDNWKKEFKIWGFNELLKITDFVTYNSFPKKAIRHWSAIIFDEVHHFTERCAECSNFIRDTNMIGLSATVKPDVFLRLKSCFKNLYVHSMNLKNAIDEGILPEPKVFLLPLVLDNQVRNVTYIVKKVNKKTANNQTDFKQLVLEYPIWQKKYYRRKDQNYIVKCTQSEYYDELSYEVMLYRSKRSNDFMRNKWLHAAGERLKWLSAQKQQIIQYILEILKNHRILIFSGTIEQTQLLKCTCINSKDGTEGLDKFNNNEVNHLASVGMVNEGINLVNCQVGLFQMINSSELLNTQKIGRLIRHKNPILIFPYFKNTREEEIINERILNTFKPENIKTVKGLSELRRLIDTLKE